MSEGAYDIAVIGGGINGCGIARDAAGRGHKVLLVEQGDLAGATSSASTKLIHGGLRYLEHYDFRLVHEALSERDVLLRLAPHNIRPLRFVLPHHKGLRPRWMLRAGLMLYDLLGAARLAPARAIDLAADEAGAPLEDEFRNGFSYSDCWTDDARLTVLNAVDAAARGADIRVRTKLMSAARSGDHWRLTLDGEGGGETRARTLVNAAGAHVNEVLKLAGVAPSAGVRLVQGSHIVVPRLFAHESAYIFQQTDGRIVFALPFERDFTLVGTTDQPWRGGDASPAASAEEIAYLCAAVNGYFKQQITPADVVWTFSGVRSLYDDGASAAKDVTRDYVLALDSDGPPVLSIYGGKITTYRRLAEAALAKLRTHVGGRAWTKAAPLPGGDFSSLPELVARLRARFAFLDDAWALRLARAYGTGAFALFDVEPGDMLCANLSAREVDYLVAHEWARTAEDVLWRRTKLGLNATADDVVRVEAHVRSALA